MTRGILATTLLFASLASLPAAAEGNEPAGQAGAPGQGPSLKSPVFFPKIIQDVKRLQGFVRADAFSQVRSQYGDLIAVDLIFASALELTGKNRLEALLICLFATLNHRNFGVRLNPLGTLLWIPISPEFDHEFQERLSRLPRQLYPDSPGTRFGDVDKLQHFFGSALLAFVSRSPEATDRVGDWVELIEAHFIVEGKYDERDRRANAHGRMFGLTLLRNEGASPSAFFKGPS